MYRIKFPKSFQIENSDPFMVRAFKVNLVKMVTKTAVASMNQTISREFGLKQLRVKAFDAGLHLEGLNFEPLDLSRSFRPYKMKMVRTTSLNPNLELEPLDFNRPAGKQFKMRMVKTTPVDPNLNL